MGWLAAQCHLAGRAPVGILSLAVGIALGWGAATLAAWVGVVCRKWLVTGAVLFALVAIFTEHAWLYRDFRRQWHEARLNPQVAMFRPEEPWSPAEYMRHEASGPRIALWGVDAVLIAAGTLGVVLLRRPAIHGDADKNRFVVADDANSN
ncbi:MAG: hypothetical protein AB7I57_07175 [Pirellulales bacterium]